jgi:predicted 2-oxoglutarate/Fe(II)-dependent dioxygenase YbiX
MSRHIDNIHHSHGQQYGHPQASILLFLNDDYKGGDLIIGDNNYNTKKGDAIMFPSNFMFPHEVLEVESGTRYSTITWVM